MQEQTQEQDSFHGSRFLMRLPQNQGGFTEGQVRCHGRTCCCRAPHMTTGAQFWLHSPESQNVPSPAPGRAQPRVSKEDSENSPPRTSSAAESCPLGLWEKWEELFLKSGVQDLCGSSCLILVSIVWSSILQPIHELHTYIGIKVLRNKDLLLQCLQVGSLGQKELYAMDLVQVLIFSLTKDTCFHGPDASLHF